MGQYVGLLHPPLQQWDSYTPLQQWNYYIPLSGTTTPPVVVPPTWIFLISTQIVDRGDLGPFEIADFFARLFFGSEVGLLHPLPVVVPLLHPLQQSHLFGFFFIFFHEKLTLVVTSRVAELFLLFFQYRGLQGDPQNNLAESGCP